MVKVFELFTLKELNERNAEPRYIHFYILFRQRKASGGWVFKP
jgi:hypothetical protein